MRVDEFLIVSGETIAWLGELIKIGLAGLMCVGAPIVAIEDHSVAPLFIIPGAFVVGLVIENFGKAIIYLGYKLNL